MSTSSTIENQKAPPDSLHSVALRLRELEKRVAKLEGIPTGYVCVGCKRQRPENHYIYSAYNSETHEEIRPLCADCIRGGLQTVKGPPWKHNGPYPQNDKISEDASLKE